MIFWLASQYNSGSFFILLRHLNPILHKIGKQQLREIRQNTDWRTLFLRLQLTKDETRSRTNDWWASSPFSEDKTASFHLNDDGWYCHATQQGGGPLELVQEVLSVRTGQRVNIFQAGAWIVDSGASHFAGDGRVAGADDSGEVKEETVCATELQKAEVEPQKINPPIKQDLSKLLAPDHPYLAEREIGAETCQKMRCGFLPEGKSLLAGRIVFQVRGVELAGDQIMTPILTHMGRAVTNEQCAERGKWTFYKGFHKSLELYHLDRLLTDEKVTTQAKSEGRIVLVEGCTDVAKLVEAGLENCVASFGSNLSAEQMLKLSQVRDVLGISELIIFYDRDEAGQSATEAATELLRGSGWSVGQFDWSARLGRRQGRTVTISEAINDPSDFSADQLRWLRGRGRI